MSRFVVLLRGVNVGKGNKVPMAEFRALLEELGHGSVRTLLNSGNAVFDSSARSTARLAADIAAALETRLSVVTPVIVKSAAELAAVVNGNPIVPDEAEHSRFIVAFAMDGSKLLELAALKPLLQPGERMAVTPQAVYLHCAGGLLESPVGAALLGQAGRGVTTRNWGTTLKLNALVGSA